VRTGVQVRVRGAARVFESTRPARPSQHTPSRVAPHTSCRADLPVARHSPCARVCGPIPTHPSRAIPRARRRTITHPGAVDAPQRPARRRFRPPTHRCTPSPRNQPPTPRQRRWGVHPSLPAPIAPGGGPRRPRWQRRHKPAPGAPPEPPPRPAHRPCAHHDAIRPLPHAPRASPSRVEVCHSHFPAATHREINMVGAPGRQRRGR